jgi:hypothetical protein
VTVLQFALQVRDLPLKLRVLTLKTREVLLFQLGGLFGILLPSLALTAGLACWFLLLLLQL